MLNRSLLHPTENPTPLFCFARWLLVAAALVLPGSATAIPVTFTFSDTIAAGPAIPGVSTGDALTLTIVADNGNATLLNQSWNLADIVSAFASVGTYSATYLPPHAANPVEPVFTTNGAGVLNNTRWVNVGPNNTDVFSGGLADADVFFGQNALIDAQDRVAFLNGNVLSEAQWSVVPEPSTLSLSALGLLGLAAARRRRTAA
jgi:hypothetical protein